LFVVNPVPTGKISSFSKDDNPLPKTLFCMFTSSLKPT